MRALRFVGPGDDADHVIIETPDGAERFVLPVDSALRDLVRLAAARQRPAPPALQAALSPREIQMRVRAGASPQDVADSHDMSLASVLRFAAPVIAERVRIADEARRSKARRSTTEGQTVVFGEAVDDRFAAHGIDPNAVTWNAYRRDDGQWIVTAGWLGGDVDRIAEWVFHLAARKVTPLDESAADLLSDRPIRPVLTQVDGPVRPSLAAAPPLARGVVAFPPMPDAETTPLPSSAELDEVYDQDGVDADAPRADLAANYNAPPLPLRLAEPAEPAEVAPVAADSVARKRTKRAPKVPPVGIPSWDDILLGVRRKGD